MRIPITNSLDFYRKNKIIILTTLALLVVAIVLALIPYVKREGTELEPTVSSTPRPVVQTSVPQPTPTPQPNQNNQNVIINQPASEPTSEPTPSPTPTPSPSPSPVCIPLVGCI